MTDLVAYFGKHWPYDCVIIDESTSFADHKTARWIAMAKVAQRVKRLHLLSGTPAPEGIQQLFAQTYLLDQGERFGREIGRFRKKYMMQDFYTKKWSAQLGAIEAVTNLIKPIAMVMREQDYLPMDKPLLIERPFSFGAVCWRHRRPPRPPPPPPASTARRPPRWSGSFPPGPWR